MMIPRRTHTSGPSRHDHPGHAGTARPQGRLHGPPAAGRLAGHGELCWPQRSTRAAAASATLHTGPAGRSDRQMLVSRARAVADRLASSPHARRGNRPTGPRISPSCPRAPLNHSARSHRGTQHPLSFRLPAEPPHALQAAAGPTWRWTRTSSLGHASDKRAPGPSRRSRSRLTNSSSLLPDHQSGQGRARGHSGAAGGCHGSCRHCHRDGHGTSAASLRHSGPASGPSLLFQCQCCGF